MSASEWDGVSAGVVVNAWKEKRNEGSLRAYREWNHFYG